MQPSDLRGLLTAVLVVGVSACAIPKPWVAEEPEPEPEPLPAFEWAPDEARAAARLSRRMPSLVLNAQIEPHWIEGTDHFWYRRQHDFGVEFIRVDPFTKTREPAFDHVAMANALSEQFQREYDPQKLPIRELVYTDPDAPPAVRIAQGLFACELVQLSCAAVPETAPAIVADEGALYWVADSGERELLAAAGEDGAEWGVVPDSAGDEIVRRRSGVQLQPSMLWSPDKSRVVTQRINQSHVPLLPVQQASADDGSARPVVHQLHIPLPGEPAATAELYVFDAQSGKRVQLDTGKLEVPLGGPIARGHLWWSDDGQALYWVQSTPGGVKFHRFDAKTGKRKTLVNEAGSAASWPSRLHDGSPVVKVLKNGDVIWYSTASGYGHLYRHPADGSAPVTLTRGNWDVHELVFVDEEARVIFFSGGDSGDPVSAEEDEAPAKQALAPGAVHLYRVGFDGNDLRRLTQEPAVHRLSASPTARYFVDHYSRPDWPSETVVRDRFGRIVMPLETGYTDNLIADGFVMPEVFSLDSGVGRAVTGTLYKPSNFDPARRWAVIDLLPPGSLAGDRAGAVYAQRYEAQALAEAGFIVVAIERDAPRVEQHVAAISRLAEARPWMDLARVGVFGVAAGGADVVRALVEHADFYRVGVAVSGSHDARLGSAAPAADGVDALQDLDRIRGRLLLAHGEIDDRVHVSHTLRVVDALMRADKKFDMLIAPNVGHNLVGLPWMQKRTWEYFWRYLGGPRLLGEPLPIAENQQAPAYHLEAEILPTGAGADESALPDGVEETIDRLNDAEETLKQGGQEVESGGVFVID